MHKDSYPNLFKQFPLDNFEVIISVLQRDYADLYPIEIMEGFYKNGRGEESKQYIQFFEKTLNELKEKYTEKEVQDTIARVLTLYDYDFVNNAFIFPKVKGSVPKPLGFMEKLATGHLSHAEPLSYIDMVRCTSWFNDMNKSSFLALNNYVVTPLANLSKDTSRGKVTLLNLHPDPNQTPKWVVVDYRAPYSPVVYCEAPILESEKQVLESKIQTRVAPENFKGGKAALSVSSGYTALAWCMKQVNSVCALKLDSDFFALVEEFTFLQPNISIFNGEDAPFFTPEFRQFKFGQPGSSIYSYFTRSVILGQLGEDEFTPNDLCAALPYYNKASKTTTSKQINYNARSYILGFDNALGKPTEANSIENNSAESDNVGYITENSEDELVSLNVPDNIDIDGIQSAYSHHADRNAVDNQWLSNYVFRPDRNPMDEDDLHYATAMVLAVFRSCAKLANLEVSLPHKFQLDKKETDLILKFMENNPFVCQLTLGKENRSLQAVKGQLQHIFARNRWLKEKGYKPPMFDDFWKHAAYHWLIHLSQTPDVLLDKRDNELFKRCVTEMGIHGLRSVLNYLKNEVDSDRIQKIYGNDKPPFYLNCPPQQMESYLDELLDHLDSQFYFPFSELGVTFSTENSRQIIRLISAVNTLNHFEQVTLTDCLQNRIEAARFLREISSLAKEQNWTTLVVIPELHDKENVTSYLAELRSVYAHLNNIILTNQRIQKANDALKQIEDLSDFDNKETTQSFEASSSKADSAPVAFDTLLKRLSNKKVQQWHIQRGGETQLQLQQQQEIQQARQLQKEHQRMNVHQVEEAFFEGLISYDNIDERLSKFLEAYRVDHEVNEKYALQKTSAESLLQGFFHTWINANPHVPARDVIRYMTKDAVVELLKHQSLAASGLKLDNLPKGFFLQRSKEGDYILSFKADMDYVYPPNAQTLRLNVRHPELEFWEGDFRQFEINSYLDKKDTIETQDWQYMASFAALQPTHDYTSDYKEFIDRNPDLAEKLGAKKGLFGFVSSSSPVKDKVIKHWPIVIQAWQYLGNQGVDLFLKQDPAIFEIEPVRLQHFLLKDLSPQLVRFCSNYPMKLSLLKALGQVYYRYGTKGMSLLLSKFSQMDAQLGEAFFTCFFNDVLKRCDNFNAFMTNEFFISMDNMMQQLKGSDNEGARLAWQSVIKNHYRTTDWDDFTHLWKAFSNFNQELARMGLSLDGNEFNHIPDNNMVVYLDRVLDCLRHMPNQENQHAFLHALSKWDMTHGGLPYAIVQEKFRYFEQSLQLTDFTEGTPTYAPDLADVYNWPNDKAVLQIQRALASLGQISKENFDWLRDQVAEPTHENRHILLLLANTRFKANNVPNLVSHFRTYPENFKQTIATVIHETVYQQGFSQLHINWEAIDALADLNYAACLQQLGFDKNLLLLEAITLLQQKHELSQDNLDNVVNTFEQLDDEFIDLSEYHANHAFKLAAIFDAVNMSEIKSLTTLLNYSKPIVQQEVRLLFRHLLSVDFQQTPCENLNNRANWQALKKCIEDMDNDPANTGEKRLALIEKLSDKNGIVFRYSKGGDFRALKGKAEEGPDSLRFFTDHEDRIWRFLETHIAVKIDENVEEQLTPIMNFLKQLQINVTYLNEIEPLLSVLEKTEPGQYWSAQYFTSMLNALTPEEENSAFPINLMKTIITEAALSARPMNEVDEEFPQKIADMFNLIQKNTVFNRDEQALLAQLAMHEFDWTDGTNLTTQILTTLSSTAFTNTRSSALAILCQCDSKAELERRFQYCKNLIELPTVDFPEMHQLWTKTMSLWLKSMHGNSHVEELFQQITETFNINTHKQALILNIVAWSSLHPGLLSKQDHQHEVKRKAPKLIEKLGQLTEDELHRLASCYPHQPSPRASDILALCKQRTLFAQVTKTENAFKEALANFEKHPFIEPRPDYYPLALSRQSDLDRMLKEVQVSCGDTLKKFNVEDCSRISLIFAYLKELESGTQGVKGADKRIQEMTQTEIADSFNRLSKELASETSNTILQAQVFALMFEAMGRTTRKYPHLAQQFALIANELFVKSDSRVLQLSVGEGKSHYVAMQAARHAAQGKTVDVCTAKRSLATRDLEDDYKDFFEYLGLTSTVVHPKTSHKDYMSHQIHYSTLGDLSLFLDEQNYAGTPVLIPREQRVGLFDEFDFTRFEEGRKTEYNFARPTGYTPKQLVWFYQSINNFYSTNQEWIVKDLDAQINIEVLVEFARALIKDAGDLETRQHYVARLIEDPLKMVQYLQSAHEAARLEKGVHFTVQDAVITVGEEHYPMREIIPLSTDNQRMTGSTFSAGVHQLLAVRLNTDAKKVNEPQNFHIHPESHILSSQVAAYHMQNLWGHREGFSGTISDVQKHRLFKDEKTVVLHAPTNRPVQRNWHQATFYDSKENRADAIKQSLLDCLASKKSVLVCCQNDKQVEELQKVLDTKLTPGQLTQLIFYTNEDPRTAKDILVDKKHKEGWQGDKKERGIALIASGFGRGDNTGTEAVFILGSRDFSDLTQKGGRTARNGEAGDVFQFYLRDELKVEEKVYFQRLSKGTPAMKESLNTVMDTYQEDTDENHLKRVLVLREYCFELDNIVNETYHHILAQYSSWGMRLLACFHDPILRQELTTTFSNTMRSLEKSWIDVEANPDAATDAKQQMLVKRFTQQAEDFISEYNKALQTDTTQKFEIKHIPQPLLDLSIPEERHSRQYAGELSFLFNSLTSLPSIDWSDERIHQFPERIQEMLNADNQSYLLRYISNMMRKAESAQIFLDWFEKLYYNHQHPSKEWSQQLESVLQPTDNKDVLQSIDKGLDELALLMSSIHSSVQDEVAQYLNHQHPASVSERVERIKPLLYYINQFDLTEMENWGPDYINNVDILHQHYQDIMANVDSLPNMSFHHLKLFVDLLHRYPVPDSVDNSTMIKRLNELMLQNLEDHVRILHRLESLVSLLPTDNQSRLFHDMFEVIRHYVAEDNWEEANRLLSKTESWLGKPNHRENIIQFWQVLAGNVAYRNQLKPLFDRALLYPGQAWYQIPALCLDKHNASIEQLIDFQDIWLDLWDEMDQGPGKSINKRSYLAHFIKHLLELNAEEVTATNYDQFLKRCYRQITNRKDDVEITSSAIIWLTSSLEQFGFENVMTFVNALDTLMQKETGYQLSPINMVIVYGRCRAQGLESDRICDHDFIRVLRDICDELDISDKLSDPVKIDTLNRYLNTMRVIGEPSICKKMIDDLRGASIEDNNLTTLEAMDVLSKCVQAGIDEPLFYRYQNALVSIWQRIDSTTAHHDEAHEAFNQYLKHLIEFDDEKLKDFITNHDGILGKAKEEQVEYLLADVMAFPGNKEQQSKRIWRMRFILDGLLQEAVPESGALYHWSSTKNESLLSVAFALFAKAFQAVFDFVAPDSRLKAEKRVQAHHQAMTICQELQLIGNFNTVEFADPASYHSFRNQQLEIDLSNAVTNYQNSWFMAHSRKEQAQALKEGVQLQLQTYNGWEPSLLQILQTLKQSKLEAMQDDIALNKTRWFKINRGGRSRYYDTLNQMQDLVMKHWTREKFDVDEPVNKQMFFLCSTEYQQFAKEDLHDHLTVFEKCLKPYLEQEKATKRFFFADYHQQKNLDIYQLLVSINLVTVKPAENIGKKEIELLIPQLEICQQYLPGELSVILKDVLQRAKGMEDMPKLEEQAVLEQ